MNTHESFWDSPSDVKMAAYRHAGLDSGIQCRLHASRVTTHFHGSFLFIGRPSEKIMIL
jgi:hypothetical protein